MLSTHAIEKKNKGVTYQSWSPKRFFYEDFLLITGLETLFEETAVSIPCFL